MVTSNHGLYNNSIFDADKIAVKCDREVNLVRVRIGESSGGIQMAMYIELSMSLICQTL